MHFIDKTNLQSTKSTTFYIKPTAHYAKQPVEQTYLSFFVETSDIAAHTSCGLE